MSGPLAGVRVIEFAGIGPAPFCGMLFADMGADVVRVDRVQQVELGQGIDPKFDFFGRGKRSLGIDLKRPLHLETALRLVERADVLIEGYRPGVLERLGLGPDVCRSRNPRLVYGRVTGWGQSGPLAQAAGHDINYIALTGALHAIGRAGQAPVPPLALLGDLAGGAMFLAFGILCALHEASISGQGQVVDTAITDCVSVLMGPFYGRLAADLWHDRRGANVLDAGAPWYDSYETRDGKYVSIGPIEERFYAQLVHKMGLDPAALPDRHDRSSWPLLRETFALAFKSRTRDEWCTLLEGGDACFAPVLSLSEAPSHRHNVARRSFVDLHGYLQPAPGPRLSRTPGAVARPAPRTGEGGAGALADWGLGASDIEALRASGGICDG